MEEFARSNYLSLELAVLLLMLQGWICCLHSEICDVGKHRGGNVPLYGSCICVVYWTFFCIFSFLSEYVNFFVYVFLCVPVTSLVCLCSHVKKHFGTESSPTCCLFMPMMSHNSVRLNKKNCTSFIRYKTVIQAEILPTTHVTVFMFRDMYLVFFSHL